MEQPVETGSRRTLFYVVKRTDGYFVWETTPSEIFERAREDPTLHSRLDRTPFTTLAEADQRRQELTAARSKKNQIHTDPRPHRI